MEKQPRFILTREARNRVVQINWSSDSLKEEVVAKRSALRYAERQARILEECDLLQQGRVPTPVRIFLLNVKALGIMGMFNLGRVIHGDLITGLVHTPEINSIVASDSIKRRAV